jgi:glycosyltransferase involved in cell wall biosynthesis
VKLVFYCPPAGYATYPFDGASFQYGLGGSEAALVCLASALARRGHEVRVYTTTGRETMVGGVSYRPAQALASATCDVFVLFRFHEHVPELTHCRLAVFWSTDIPTDDPPYRVGASLLASDLVVALSPFHAGLLLEFARARGLPDLSGRLWVGGCGIHWPEYRRPLRKRRHRFIYCSVPDRGLSGLLEMWPAIRRALPDASLVLTGGYELWGRRSDNASYPSAAGCPGVEQLGVVPRHRLVREQLAAEIHVHPCPLPENFCIASMECQAAGTPSVTSSLGAMSTTVVDGRTGIVVTGDPASATFRQRFVTAVVDLAQDRSRLQAMAAFGRRRAHRQFDYDVLAARWEQVVQARLAETTQSDPNRAKDGHVPARREQRSP